jgi:hypothetical protein
MLYHSPLTLWLLELQQRNSFVGNIVGFNIKRFAGFFPGQRAAWQCNQNIGLCALIRVDGVSHCAMPRSKMPARMGQCSGSACSSVQQNMLGRISTNANSSIGKHDSLQPKQPVRCLIEETVPRIAADFSGEMADVRQAARPW